ncbi:unnamed protein product [Rotaria sp. Silwood1]|nr:unnamed protein product [Rotaria sp. Silwood1]
MNSLASILYSSSSANTKKRKNLSLQPNLKPISTKQSRCQVGMLLRSSTPKTPLQPRKKTTITATTSSYNTILYFVLTSNSLQYRRIDGRSSNYYYDIKEIIISASGNYSFTSSSTFAAYCFLHANSFNSSDPLLNLVAQGHKSAGDGQYQYTVFLPFDDTMSKRAIKKRATTKYIVVISTEDESVTGSLSLVMSGPGVITVKTPDTTAISVHKNNEDGLSSGDLAGIIVGSVIGGLLVLICIMGLCIIACSCGFYCCRGRPLRSNKAYIYNGFPVHNSIGNIIFQSNTFTGFYFKDGIWYEPHYFTLAFYPQANYTVYGKGKDSLGLYVAKGVYSPRTLRMAFDKYYQTEFGNVRQNQNKKMTIQVTWNPFTQSFEGKHYLKDGKYVEEQPYIMQITNVPYFR